MSASLQPIDLVRSLDQWSEYFGILLKNRCYLKMAQLDYLEKVKAKINFFKKALQSNSAYAKKN